MRLNLNIKKLIFHSYELSFSNFKPLMVVALVYAFVGTLIALTFNIAYREGYYWLVPDISLQMRVAILAAIKVIIFTLFIVSWSKIVSKKLFNRNALFYLKILTFVSIWLVWHYVSFLGIYYIVVKDFSLRNIFIIALGAYLPFVWVRFYSMLARLLDKEDIESLSCFFQLTKGQTSRICLALLCVVAPCSLSIYWFTILYTGNLWLGEFCINLILLFFTSIWINHCYVQKFFLKKLTQK